MEPAVKAVAVAVVEAEISKRRSSYEKEYLKPIVLCVVVYDTDVWFDCL